MSNKSSVKRQRRIAELTGKTLVWPPAQVQYRLQLDAVLTPIVPSQPHMQSPKLNATIPVVRQRPTVEALRGEGLQPAPHGRIVEAEVLVELEAAIRAGRSAVTSAGALNALLRGR